MPTAKPTREERRAETRERLLNAAEQVFAERGYHAASVDEVAEKAGFSTGALYSNFEGKEDLFLALFERQVTLQAARVAASVADQPSIAERARSGAAEWVEYLQREPQTMMLYIEFWAYAVRNPEVRERYAQRYARVRDVTTAMIVRGAEEFGVELALPAEQLAMAVDAYADGFALQKLADPEGIPDDLLARGLLMLFAGAARPAPVEG
ncbi:MAG: hypothetical protein QOG62_2649 [Thermoleophilaceae bacterium]|nr:hypothetical protein [Thermoleophilaceae bacterium]